MASIKSAPFGTTPDGKEVKCFTITNKNGIVVNVIEFGGNIISIETPDKDGKLGHITLGYDNLEQWMENPTYFGSTIGRVGNRIAKGKFSIDGTEYQLATNNGPNHLHGGPDGFHKRVWSGSIVGDKVQMKYVSADMEEGYPGELSVTVCFSVTDDDTFVLDYHATTTKETIVNLTNHSYFNLNGAGSGTVLDHVVQSNCRAYTVVDGEGIPSGDLATVDGTPFDFTKETSIGDRNAKVSGGYDHNLVVNRTGIKDGELAKHMTVTAPTTGRRLTVSTTEPGCQIYVGGFLDGSNIGREKKGYVQFGGFCLESQKHPDSVNQSGFPSMALKPDGEYVSKTTYKFETL